MYALGIYDQSNISYNILDVIVYAFRGVKKI